MQLFHLNPNEKDNKLMLENEVKPILFKQITMNNKKTKEKDLEELIIANPTLLNQSENDYGSCDLLIISQQLTSNNNKRADLVALDKEGYLVTIEIKRDADDEKNRNESMEFQSIRYAANHRTLDVEGVINIYADYLRNRPGAQPQPNDDFRALAVKNGASTDFGG